MTEPYDVDDRGNIAQFYDVESGDIIATLDREAGENADEYTWDGDEAVTAWAKANGYPNIDAPDVQKI
jgi:hypothetical protein